MAVRILTVNCQGLSSVGKRTDVFYLKAKQCHIYCLQDIHATPRMEKFIHSLWGSDCLFSYGSLNSRGVAICFQKNIDYKIHSHLSDPDGNYITVDLTIDDNSLTLIYLYGPNKDCPEFFTTIIRHIETLNNNTSILCGDFNVQDPDLDYYNYCGINNKKSHEKIQEIKENLNLIDSFREANPKLRRYTWRKKTPLKQARLDYFLISENLLSSIGNCIIESSYCSDHSMVALHINFMQFIKGKPLWKHNKSLLSDINYLKTMNDKINDVKKQYAEPIYNLENLHEIPNDQIQFTINDQLFLETLLME